MAHNIHDLGDDVRVAGSFSDATEETAIDPDVVSLSVKAPDDTVTSYVYGTDPEITRDSLGEYSSVIDANQTGMWFYRWWSTGDGKGAFEQRFEVRTAQAIEED